MKTTKFFVRATFSFPLSINFRTDSSGKTDSADPDQTHQQSDQGLHCVLFRLHRLDPLLYGKDALF